ncbi:MAG: DUF4010 domain-containing protein [Acidobacteriia bacterium]|nr:DUF4010 domain-containing protein [Terriglobia bacterium]
MFETARPFLLAIAIGLLVGIERERAHADRHVRDPLGSRTFTLLALLGAVAAYVESQPFAIALAAFAGAIILAGYLRAPLGPEGSGVGATTEVAAMVTFTLGYLARFEVELTVMLAVITLVVLALKPRIHHFAQAGLSSKEVSAALTFLVIAFVVLPLLPNRAVDPWGLFNPFRLWLLFALITGIGFGGYFAVRALGPGRGLAVAGLFGGFVSSTATTLSLARKNREAAGLAGHLAAGIVLANAASAAAQLVVVSVANPDMVARVFPVVGWPVAVGALAGAGFVWRLSRAEKGGDAATEFKVDNPLALESSAGFAALLGLMLVITSAATRAFGPAGVLATAALGGAMDVHAVTLAVSTLAAAGTLTERGAVLAILVGFLANMVVKISLAGWAGGRRLFVVVVPPLVAMMAAGVAAFLVFVGR